MIDLISFHRSRAWLKRASGERVSPALPIEAVFIRSRSGDRNWGERSGQGDLNSFWTRATVDGSIP
jgi:hypothetical protein